ncbi:MAG: hypothetical protein ACMXYA_01065 [Candidatus Woesearchaeota archaeon]
MEKKIENLREKYERKIQTQFRDVLTAEDMHEGDGPVSSEYLNFKQENVLAHMNWYEQICQFFEKNIPLSPDKVSAKKMQEDIDTIHLQVTPSGVMSAAVILPLTFIMVSSMLVYIIFQSMILLFMFVVAGLIMMVPLYQLPAFLAQNWRMKASNQMVLAVFYIVTYMRHTSNLERAIDFASKHLAKPLSMDLKKVIWDVETEKYENVFDSLENYLHNWDSYNDEFVESMHVIMGSLYESDEQKRQELLDKALDLILEETFDKMLHYAHNLQSPITALHMLGIVLPILGLIILPLMVNFMGGVEWYYIAVVYNVFLPIGIYFMGKRILSTRPSGYGGVEIDEDNPLVRELSKPTVKIGSKEYTIPPVPILVLLIVFGLFFTLLPVVLHFIGFEDVGLPGAEQTMQPPCGYSLCLLGYFNSTEPGQRHIEKGPYGLGATLLSLLLPFSIAMGLALFFSLKSNRLMKMRTDTEKLEVEFTSALFQLGNRMGDGLPAEIAFEKVARNMPNSRSGKFFRIVSTNIQKMGMSVNDAIFDPKVGALVYYPSNLIESSMRILTQSAQKGPLVASNAISNVARYIKEMNRVNERLQDLMAEVISSMRSQINFLTPIISGIVLGITSMISTILLQLRLTLGEAVETGDQAPVGGGVTAILQMFGDGIPAYFFSIIVGLYVLQVIYILSVLVNGIQKGVDPINERYLIGKNMIKSMGLYIGISVIILLVFNLLATSIMVGVL